MTLHLFIRPGRWTTPSAPPGRSRRVVIAGGTDVLIKIREGKLAGCSLVSIHELGEELSGVDAG